MAQEGEEEEEEEEQEEEEVAVIDALVDAASDSCAMDSHAHVMLKIMNGKKKRKRRSNSMKKKVVEKEGDREKKFRRRRSGDGDQQTARISKEGDEAKAEGKVDLGEEIMGRVIWQEDKVERQLEEKETL